MITVNKPKLATDADHTVGSRIALLRAARGMSQTALGQALGVSFQQVQKYEKGRNRVGAGRLQTIAEHLGVPVSAFFDGGASEVLVGGTSKDLSLLGIVGAVEILKAYAEITDPQMCRDVLAMVKSASRLQKPAAL